MTYFNELVFKIFIFIFIYRFIFLYYIFIFLFLFSIKSLDLYVSQNWKVDIAIFLKAKLIRPKNHKNVEKN